MLAHLKTSWPYCSFQPLFLALFISFEYFWSIQILFKDSKTSFLICLSFCLLYSIPSFFVQMSFFQLYNLYALAPMFITSVSLFSIWQTVDTLDFCWLALFLALSAKTCFYEQNSHPEKNNSGHHTAVQLGQFCGEMFSSEENDLELRKLYKIQSCFLEH